MQLPINQIILGDAIETMRSLTDNSIDAIISDPPYGTTKLSWDKKIDWETWWKEAHRITKLNSIICLFAQQPFATDLIYSNRSFFRYELIWEKTMATGFLDANIRPLRAHENILIFCQKPKKSSYNPQLSSGKPYTEGHKRKAAHYGNVTRIRTENHGTRYPRSVLKFSNGNHKSLHPTQKPLDLMQWLIKTYSNEGDVIFDPFMGSGSTAVACLETGRNFIGIEKDPHYHAVAEERIASIPKAA